MVRSYQGKVKYVVENYGDSELARRFGVTRYPAVFVDDILVAKPKDFGFFGKGEGKDEGKYTPWKDASNHERFRKDLKRMIDLALSGHREELAKENAPEQAEATEIPGVPAFSLTDFSGKAISEKDLAGRVVLVEFWATWCPPCRGTLAWLGELKKRYGDRLAILAVAIESDEKDVRKVAENMKLPLTWVMGTDEMARSFGDITSVPTLFLFDQSGKKIQVFYGAPPELHADAEQKLSRVIVQ